MKTNIELQIEKLKVLQNLTESIVINDDKTTSQMLRDLIDKIEDILVKDF